MTHYKFIGHGRRYAPHKKLLKTGSLLKFWKSAKCVHHTNLPDPTHLDKSIPDQIHNGMTAFPHPLSPSPFLFWH